jgi:hypothetical protein
VFSTFRGCMSFYTARVNMRRHGSAMACLVYLQQRTYLGTAGIAVECHCGHAAPLTLARDVPIAILCTVREQLGRYVASESAPHANGLLLITGSFV